MDDLTTLPPTPPPRPRQHWPRAAWFSLIGLVVGGLVGAGVTWGMGQLNGPVPDDSPAEVRENSADYKFVNPLLECDVGRDALRHASLPSKQKIQDLIDNAKRQQKASFVAVYFRNLNNGPWMGINQEEKFYPASLLKLPIMLYYYRHSENDPGILSQQITLAGVSSDTSTQYYVPEKHVQPGETKTIEELIEYMMVYSDNDAAMALASFIPDNRWLTVFDDLHVKRPDIEHQDALSVRDYASFFRILYNASYLDQQFSEKALSMLSKSPFNKALTAKLPSDIVVAHKFGERWNEADQQRQLHDCGIVYYPKNPYLLCVMTRGENFEKEASVIADISETVFNDIKQQDQNP